MKIKAIFLTGLSILTALTSFGQLEPVNVAQLTIKVGAMSTEEFYYGFAEGDQIIFNFEEERGKKLKEIEIAELPGNSKFMDFKSSLIKDRIIQVHKEAVYKFRFYNSSLGKRVCRVTIQRIPKSEDLRTFNTDWKWETRYDTTYVPYTEDSLVGYDTLRYKEKVKELIETKRIDDIVIDRNERVGDKSVVTPRNSYSYVSFALPQDRIEPYREERTIAWAYWIGVGKEAQEAYKKNVQNIGNITSSVASIFGTPLAGVAVGAVSTLFTPTNGDNVYYWFLTDYTNAQNFKNGYAFRYFDKGNGVAGYGKNTNRLHGKYYIGLHNDNNIQDIDVNIKIVVVREIKTYEDNEYERQKVTPRYITLNKQRMVVNKTQIRVNTN